MRRVLMASVGVVVFLAARCGGARADSMTYVDSYAETRAWDAGIATGVDTGLTVGSNTATQGAASATTTWTLLSTSATLGFDLTAGGSYWSHGSSFGNATFTVDTDTTYAASGTFTFTDFGASTASESVYFRGSLYDETEASYRLLSEQGSEAAGSGTFTLGGSDGNTVSGMGGSLTGSLLAGHVYTIRWYVLLHDWPYVEADAFVPLHGSGSMSFTVGSTAPVPEPTTLALFGLGAAGIAWRKRRASARK